MSGIYEPLPDFKTEEIPERKKSFWKIAGPGAILVGLSIGAGEIIIWPRIVAIFGAGMVWAAVVGVFIQYWINLEVGRWTVVTGETVFTGYSRVWRGFAPVFIVLMLLGWLAPGWGRASGLALKALLVGPHWHQELSAATKAWVAIDFFGMDTFWTLITFAAVALLLFGPKLVYSSVEKTVEVLVAIVTIGLIVVAVKVGTSSVWRELAGGIVNFGHIETRKGLFGIKDFFIALVFAGAGGTANLFYCFYLRDKQIGMGARIPELQNVLRGRTEKVPATGYLYPETPENAKRFAQWWSYIKKDQVLFFWLLNTVTIMLFIIGSLAVLHPQGMVPSKGTLIWDEADILGNPDVWGRTGRTIFLLVGVATLFSTQLALVDGVARSISDIIYTNFRGAQKREVSWWYLVVAGAWMVAGCAITFVMERRGVSDLGFLFNAAYMGGFAMALYVPLTLYINYRYLPPSARPKAVCTIMMVVASVVYGGFAIYCLLWEVGLVKG